ncbi:MAG: hypothetical protein OHK0012_10900 [Synechococcales cyanobacterium]
MNLPMCCRWRSGISCFSTLGAVISISDRLLVDSVFPPLTCFVGQARWGRYALRARYAKGRIHRWDNAALV